MAAKKTKKKKPRAEGKKTRDQVLKANAWKPGESGNPKGRPPNPISLTSAIRSVGDEAAPKKILDELKIYWPDLPDETTLVQALARRDWIKATDIKGGDIMAKEIGERIDGKVPFPVTGEGGAPIPVQFDFGDLTKAQLDVFEKLLALCQKKPDK